MEKCFAKSTHDENDNAFDRVIGYDEIKIELKQLCDMIINPQKYEKLGAKLPHGILLYGQPGLGKTLMANCFIQKAQVPSFVVRKNKGDSSFVDFIKETFDKAKSIDGVSIVFLDDMDKFANEDDYHTDAPEYVTIQSCIDDCKGHNVLVIATANNIIKLPDSLIRSGRFDKTIEFSFPNEKDCLEIVEYYLSNKAVSNELNYSDIAKMIGANSCAYLESIINDAAIYAAFQNKKVITMDCIVLAILKNKYGIKSLDLENVDEDDLRTTAIHEAGHALVLDILNPGSVGFIAVKDKFNGFTRRCKHSTRRTYDILVSIAGKVATELYYGGICASGCQNDIMVFGDEIRKAVTESASRGINNVGLHMSNSDDYLQRVESVVYSEMERSMFVCRDIIVKNKEYLEKIADRLVKNRYILNSELSEIRNSCNIVNVAV